MIVLGLGLLVSGSMKRRAKIRSPMPPGAIRPEFAAMGEMMRPMLLFVVLLIAGKTLVFYLLFDGARWLSPLTFGGFMFVLAAYAAWLIMVLRPPTTAAQVATSASPSAHDVATGHRA